MVAKQFGYDLTIFIIRPEFEVCNKVEYVVMYQRNTRFDNLILGSRPYRNCLGVIWSSLTVN